MARFQFRNSGLTGERCTLLFRSVFAARMQLLTSWMRGELCAEEVVRFIASEIGADSDELFAGLVESCRRMTFVSDELPELIRRLRETGTKVVIATDNMDTFTRWTIPALGLGDLFDDILDSHSLRALKQDSTPEGESAFFGRYMAKEGLSPEECLLVDDSMQTVAAVEGFGINVLKVKKGQNLVKALSALLWHQT